MVLEKGQENAPTPPPLTRALLECGEEAVKILIAVRDEEDVQRVSGAEDGRRPLVPAEPADDAGAQAITVSHLDVVIAAAVVEFQTDHPEATKKEPRLDTEAIMTLSLQKLECSKTSSPRMLIFQLGSFLGAGDWGTLPKALPPGCCLMPLDD